MMFNEAATNIGKGNCLVTQVEFDGNRREREREKRPYCSWVDWTVSTIRSLENNLSTKLYFDGLKWLNKLNCKSGMRRLHKFLVSKIINGFFLISDVYPVMANLIYSNQSWTWNKQTQMFNKPTATRMLWTLAVRNPCSVDQTLSWHPCTQHHFPRFHHRQYHSICLAWKDKNK